MKKAISLAMCIVVIVLSLSACKEENIAKARLYGYDKVTFVTLLDKMAEEMIDSLDEGTGVEYKVKYEKGWSTDHFNPTLLDRDEMAVTYCLEMDADGEDVSGKYMMKFFAVLQKNTDMLHIRGIELTAPDETEMVCDPYEVEKWLESFEEFM